MKRKPGIRIFSFTENGTLLNRRLCAMFRDEGRKCQGYAPASYAEEGIFPLPEQPRAFIGEDWGSYDLLFIGAAGIAVRYIAPWVKDKMTDPAVLVMDERGKYVVPLLSGHVGGASELAEWIARMTGAVPVQTTATDVQGRFAVDVFAKKNHLLLTDRVAARRVSAAVLRGEQIGVWIQGLDDPASAAIHGNVPPELCLCREKAGLQKYTWGICIGRRPEAQMPGEAGSETEAGAGKGNVLYLEPRDIVVGIGCRKGISQDGLREQAEAFLKAHHIQIRRVRAIASIDLKKEERALRLLAEAWDVPFVTYSSEILRQTGEVTGTSAFVEQTTGVDNVCERAARCYCIEETGTGGELVHGKWIGERMTIAVVRLPLRLNMGQEAYKARECKGDRTWNV